MTAATVTDPAAMRPSWHDQRLADVVDAPFDQVAAALATDLQRGLTAGEATRRLAQAGPNEPAPITGPSWPKVLVRQFASTLILLLFPATIVSLLLREWLNAGAIGVTALISAAFGFVQEYRSERAIAALHRLTARRAEVVRDGLREDTPARELVPGDMIALAEGDVVPADARVIEARGVRVNESILTGEPEAVLKDHQPAPHAEGATAATALYGGTTVVAGSALAVIVATGPRTELGGIFAAMQGAGRKTTPLEARLEHLGRWLVAVFIALCVLLVGVGLLQRRDARTVVEVAVSLAISAVPEGLPAVATTALAIAVRRLARRSVLVRRLDAVETLGSTTVIVTDKTGTLTENRMVARRALLPDGRAFRLSVQTSAAGGLETRITSTDGALPAPVDREAVERVLLVGGLCNDAVVEHDAERGWHTHGDPSEAALALAAAGCGFPSDAIQAQYPRVATESFTSASRMMRTTHRTPDGDQLIAVKGAFEQVVALDSADHRPLARAVHELGDAGYRVLAVAEGNHGDRARMLGAVVLEDPLRADAAAAVRDCAAAGIRLMLVTGDQLTTATTIARDTGILTDSRGAVHGTELDLARLEEITVVARATHAQKGAIVGALQGRGEVVAMTGDGVNDAAALRAADVGVAVGPNATDVATEAADIVLADGQLSSLAHGVHEGRAITRSLRRAIVYLLTASFGTVLLITASMLFSAWVALAPLQILWLNLVVHVFPALALATTVEPDAGSVQPTRSLLPAATWQEIAWRSVTVAGAGLAALAAGNAIGESTDHRQTLVFIAIAMSLLGQTFLIDVDTPRALMMRLRRLMLWGAAGLSVILLLVALYLPGLHRALSLQPAVAGDWVIVFGCAVAGWTIGQIGAVLLQHKESEHVMV